MQLGVLLGVVGGDEEEDVILLGWKRVISYCGSGGGRGRGDTAVGAGGK